MSITDQSAAVSSGRRRGFRAAGVRAAVAAAAAVAIAAGCERKPDAGEPAAPAAAGHAAAPPAVTNRVDIPDRVRQNLGITFARAERRAVTATLRVPGRLELLPSARREYRTVLPARAELLVRQYDRVEPGQVLARLDAPDWRRVQHEAVEAEGEIKVAEANVDVADATVAENERAVALLRRRTAALAEANAPRADLAAELALAEGKAARLAAEARAGRVKLAEAKEHYASKLRTLASVVGIPADRLIAPATRPADEAAAVDRAAPAGGPPGSRPAASDEPLWKSIDAIEVRALAAGVVEAVAATNGGWVDQAGLVLATVDPRALRFRGGAPQSDLGRLREGAAAAVVAPAAAGAGADDALTGTVAFGLAADPDTRAQEVVVVPDRVAAWARPGAAAIAEVVTDGSAAPETAIPVAAVVQDELARVYFRRDPKDPDKAIRVEGDLGASDGRWVVVLSGLKAGDEVVVDGALELKLAGGGKAGGPGGDGGGHFHADGTWHAAGTPEPGAKK